MNKKLYWLGSRITSSRPYGKVVVDGPFSSYEKAMEERREAKESGWQFSVPFSAANREEAEKRAEDLIK